ncbi:unnamed protein product [Heligmosomoides polygyrus]|uniref:Uncharacterized protein n=1 Tax=Heligmosomoides polygyrus TaxID=6339 RepID=A0A183FV76_HELPZ|nr:unnamed protein product [Heligmosomoides polygyrus]
MRACKTFTPLRFDVYRKCPNRLARSHFSMQTTLTTSPLKSVSPVSPVVPLIIEFERALATSPFVPVVCHSAPMDPPRLRGTEVVTSFVQDFHEEV